MVIREGHVGLGDYNNLGEYLKEKRLSGSFTQIELSEKLKVHVQFVSNWERGLCAPPGHCFDQLITVLKLNREHLVTAMVADSKLAIESKVFAKKKSSSR